MPTRIFQGFHYRNVKLKNWIDATFDEHGRRVAWDVVRYIRREFPKTNEELRGELIGIDEEIIGE